MKKSVLFFAIMVLAWQAAAQDRQGPQISVKEVRHDLGAVAQGSAATYVFEIRNDGTETLVIERVQAS
jgi:hypothetical protein